MILERNFAPVIVFSFSKKDCEAYAMQMSKIDFNTGNFMVLCSKTKFRRDLCLTVFLAAIWYLNVSDEEKKLVEEVFNNAMECLSDEDRKLPQVCLAVNS